MSEHEVMVRAVLKVMSRTSRVIGIFKCHLYYLRYSLREMMTPACHESNTEYPHISLKPAYPLKFSLITQHFEFPRDVS
jgi:hypothetical protein